MADYTLNHFELSQYRMLKAQVNKLDERIEEASAELDELNKYEMNISPVITGMPRGNEKRDKIADYLIKLEADKQRVSTALEFLRSERTYITHRLFRIREAVNNVSDEQLRDIITWHYFDGLSIDDVAGKNYTTASSVYKKINKYLKLFTDER